jgi:hypothetical protein
LTLSFFQTFQLHFLSFLQKPLPIWKKRERKISSTEYKISELPQKIITSCSERPKKLPPTV